MNARRPARSACAAFAVVLGSAMLLAAAPASATSGVWGAGQYPYLDGQICPEGANQTAPFTSWDFGTGAPAFLITPVSSNGIQDSAVLPFAYEGSQQTSPVAAGQDGFGSAADIATYAALVSKYGGGTTEQVAQVAAAFRAKGGDPSSCAGSPAALIAAAAASAGPYTVTLSTAKTPALGVTSTLVATVRGGASQPVRGVQVNFTSTDVPVSNATVLTAADGTAKTQFTVTAGLSSSKFSFTASVSAVVGLEQLTAVTQSSFSNPTGTSATAVYLAPPVTASATTTVSIDPTASPVLQPSGSVRGLALGAPFTPRASVTGMRGHSGAATLTIYGPAALNTAGNCTSAVFGASSPVAATTNTITVTGDQQISGSPWTPDKAGCYYIGASIDTTDATPNVTVSSGFGIDAAKVTVLSATLAVTVSHPISGAGVLSAKAVPAQIGSAQGVVATTLLGPLPPAADGSCTTLNWAHAARAGGTTTAPMKGTAAVAITSSPVTAGGCYEWQPQLQLNVPDAGTIAVPTTAGTGTVLVLVPVVTLTTDQIWAATPDAVTAHVSASGIYGQPAHVSIAMRYVPTPPQGCRYANFAHATATASGPSVAVDPATAVVVARTGPTTVAGCYSPVPNLSIDAYPQITATGKVGILANTIGAGVPLADAGPPGLGVATAGIGPRAVITLVVMLLLEGGLIAALGYRVYLRRGVAATSPGVSIAAILGAPRPGFTE